MGGEPQPGQTFVFGKACIDSGSKGGMKVGGLKDP